MWRHIIPLNGNEAEVEKGVELLSVTENHLSRRTALRLTAGAGLAAATPAVLLAHSEPAQAASIAEVALPAATTAIKPFRVSVPGAALDELRRRVTRTRLPDRQTVSGWAQGVPLDEMKRLLDYWARRYDWRRFERQLLKYDQYRTLIDGVGIHFVHVKSKHRNALPILLTHGWPGSFIEFLEVIEPLTNPTAHGGTAADAFDVVIPSLPGFGFSDKPAETGWSVDRIARAWQELMRRLGYRHYVAQGGDWGSGVTHALARLKPPALLGIHTNFPTLLFAPPVGDNPDAEEQKALKQIADFQATGAAYLSLETTRPQTIGYALADSPSGQAAWIYEKIASWTDSDYNPAAEIGMDRILDDITLYWLTDTAASSGRIYWENPTTTWTTYDLPVGVTVFPKEIISTPRVWAERTYKDLIHFRTAARGGHFAAFEQPAIFTTEMRDCFRRLR
ncbi:epoxide hydrolase [Actinoplanes sp. NPDC049596]|uniref:epoxide hydrolase family protein n=1 Tax=unclassified Actinoplanes TaxID=2626549 RepID=UPI003438D675